MARKLDEEFLPPQPQNLYNEDGTLVGRKEPDAIVYDESGNPVGKRLGDFVAVNEDGSLAPTEEIPSVFYVEDPFGNDQLVPSTFIDLVPKVEIGEGSLGLEEVWIPNLVTFDATDAEADISWIVPVSCEIHGSNNLETRFGKSFN